MLSRTTQLAHSIPLRRTILRTLRASSTSRSPSNPPTVPNPPSLSSSSTSSPAPSRASDPFPLPFSPELAPQFEGLPPSSTNSPSPEEESALSELLAPLRKERQGESVETLRARLTYQTRKRGTLEADLLLSTFAREQLGGMGEEQLLEFDRLLDEPDWDIYYWAIDKRPPPARWAGTELLDKLRVHARNEGRVVRRMPDLWAGRASAEGEEGK